MKYELLKPKNADILEIKGQIKKVHYAKKFWFFFKILIFLGHHLKKFFLLLYNTEFIYFLGY